MEWGTPRSSGVGFFCFDALGDTKQKKPTPLDRGPPLHVNRPLDQDVSADEGQNNLLYIKFTSILPGLGRPECMRNDKLASCYNSVCAFSFPM